MPDDIKLNNDKTAAVNKSMPWLDARKHPPPRGAKLLCINRALGIAVISSWVPSVGFTHWQALPHFEE